METVVNVQGDLPTIDPATIRAVFAPLRDSAIDIATLAGEIVAEHERTNPNVVKMVGSPVAPAGSGRSISRAPPRPGARGRSTTTSAFTPIVVRRSSAS